MRIQNCLEMPQIHKHDFPNIQRFHADPQIMENDQYCFQHICDLINITCVFGLFTIVQDVLGLHHRKISFLTLGEANCFDPPDLQK